MKKYKQIFPENQKNCQNQGYFQGVVLGRRIYASRYYVPSATEDNAEQKVDCPAMMTPLELAMHYFFQELNVKRPKLSKNQMIDNALVSGGASVTHKPSVYHLWSQLSTELCYAYQSIRILFRQK